MTVCSGPFSLFVVGRLGWIGLSSVLGYEGGLFPFL